MTSVNEQSGKRINPFDPLKREYISAVDQIKQQLKGYKIELNQDVIDLWQEHYRWDVLILPEGEATIIEFNKFPTLEYYDNYLQGLITEAFIEIRRNISEGATLYDKLSIATELNGYFKNELVRFGYYIKIGTEGDYELSYSDHSPDYLNLDPSFIDAHHLDEELVNEIENCIFKYIKLQFKAVSQLVKFLDIQYEILKSLIPTNKTIQESTEYKVLTTKEKDQDVTLRQKIVQPPVLILPENFNLPKLNLVAERLDIRQTALLFDYFRKIKVILNYKDESLAEFVYAFTGHSEQNIRTKKGFGKIEDIKRDHPDTKTKDFKVIPNHNLVVLKSVLAEIISEIDKQMDKNIAKNNV